MGGPGRRGEGIMAMNRFYVDKRQIQGEWVRITGDDVRHIAKY